MYDLFSIKLPIEKIVILLLYYNNILLALGCTVVSIGATKASVEGEFILYNPLYKPETESANIYIKETSLFAIPV